MSLQRAALWTIVVAAAIFAIVAGRGLLLPFVMGVVLWYMIHALADAFETPRLWAWRLPRAIALGGFLPAPDGDAPQHTVTAASVIWRRCQRTRLSPISTGSSVPSRCSAVRSRPRPIMRAPPTP